MKYKTFYKRNLPHFQPLDYPYFVTFRLYNSLPMEIIIEMQNKNERELKRIAGINNVTEKRNAYNEYQKEYFEIFDDLLSKTIFGPTWLGEEEVANIIKEAIHFRDGKEYELIAYTIMSNHIHIVFIPLVQRIADSLLVFPELWK
ncbi:MAG: hypothetical protein P4L45_08765 [Ignavibacteriaceae bacterium]|nr:hypothetical protein [Ignavibacteriaceae bacterium]